VTQNIKVEAMIY